MEAAILDSFRFKKAEIYFEKTKNLYSVYLDIFHQFRSTEHI